MGHPQVGVRPKSRYRLGSQCSVPSYRTACVLTRSPVLVIQSHRILYQTPRFALDDLHHLARNVVYIVRLDQAGPWYLSLPF
jgi:hypothetical protein